MLVADGCTICLVLLKDGTSVEWRKYEGGWDPGTGRCHDCGAKVCQYHHPGCDVERCPACGQQTLCWEHLEGAKCALHESDQGNREQRLRTLYTRMCHAARVNDGRKKISQSSPPPTRTLYRLRLRASAGFDQEKASPPKGSERNGRVAHSDFVVPVQLEMEKAGIWCIGIRRSL
jgi:hypothetical protein